MQLTACATPAATLPSPDEMEQRAFDRHVAAWASTCAATWLDSEEAFANLGPAVPEAEKRRREQQADQHFEAMEQHLRHWPAAAAKREAWRQELLRALRGMALEHLSCDAAAIHRLFTPEAMEATRHFLRQAKAFAPAITDADLFQALRNVWVMHSVQLLLGAEIALTPAVFAYSMLYPWTDNVLDNVQVGHEAKIELGDWLALRLAGQAAPPPNAHCAQISALIGMIERQYPRPEFPGVYFSLQAIHTAQMRSLAQQNAAAADDEHWLLRLSIAKGGASVLADAWLTRGSLTHEEAEFMFAYGVVLQLMDDLQDLADDLKHRHNTLFSRQAGLGALDALTGRLWAFTQRALRVPCGSASAPSDSVRLMIGENLRLMLLQGVARHRECYTPSFLRSVEAASPVSFAYLARQEASLRERYSKALRSVQRKRKLASAFELLD